MRVISYKRIARFATPSKVAQFRARFGGDGVPINQEAADFCRDQDYCRFGIENAVFAGLSGSIAARKKLDAELLRRANCQDWHSYHMERYDIILKHAIRFHGINRRAPKSA